MKKSDQAPNYSFLLGENEIDNHQTQDIVFE